MHPNIDADGAIQPDPADLLIANQLDEDPGRSLHHPHDFHLVAIVTPTVLAPSEPTDALELHVPVLAIEGWFLMEGLKRLHAAAVRLEAREPMTLLEEPLERPVDPDQCRILTPSVKLAKPFIGLADRGQRTTLVIQTNTPTGFLLAVDPFLQRAVV